MYFKLKNTLLTQQKHLDEMVINIYCGEDRQWGGGAGRKESVFKA